INNYCYFITAVNICDSVADSSRIICSMYRNDTAISPAFSFVKDTIVKVYAFDTASYTTSIFAIDSKDSVYVQCIGNVFGSPKLLSFQSQNGLSKATIKFTWSSPCDGITTVDTPYILFYVKDNQCPQPRTNNGRIQIVTLPPPLNEPPVLSCIKFLDANTLQIKWPKTFVNKFFTKFFLLRKTPDGKIAPFTSVSNGNAFSTNDNNAFGNLTNNYCYAVTSQDVCGFFGDTGIFKCSIRQPSDYPTFINFSTVTVQGDKNIGVYWERSQESNFQNYILTRHDLNDYSKISPVYSTSNLNDTGFVDQNVSVHLRSYCYIISQVNECGLQSIKNPEACSILLKGNVQPFEHSLLWNGYNYWNLGVSQYDVNRIQPALNVEFIGSNPDKDTAAIDENLNYENGDYFYYVVAHESVKGRNNISTSNQVELIQPPLLHVPNAFSPNADNTNDNWRTVPVFVKTYHLKIYDRWGKMVFQSDDKHTLFNGTIDGNVPATGDVFVYLITYTGWDDVVYTRKGNLTVLK
ncbi:MAG: gliding motility-associated C-terminal domain-containing protein, partial [Bacteroidia bacterium]